jgi:UDP-N-acetylmuramoyl-tripeptide--D-alanyl-D-alanine ligase
MMRLAEVALATGGVLRGEDVAISGVSTDSREALTGKLFVALRGERFDAHEFLAQAIEQGAAAALVERSENLDIPANFPLIVVKDTRLALGALSGWWRSRFSIPVIGVTGSNGKTTVKEMCAAILRSWVAQSGGDCDAGVLATKGNLNNDIGLPQMMLRLNTSHRAAVLEMGMNHPGEIRYLAGLASPTVAVVTNAQRAHLAGMGELSAVAEEKGCIYAALRKDGVAVINLDDLHASYWQQAAQGHRIVTFGLDDKADVSGSATTLLFGSRVSLRTAQGEAEFELRVPGIHNVRNALASVAATLAAGVPLSAAIAGLETFAGAKGRLQVRAALNGGVLLDDTYNANPDSVRAGIDVLASAAGTKILVLGDMGEIGQMSAQYHDEIGGYAKSQGIDRLFALGESSALAARNFGSGGEHFGTVEELIEALKPALGKDVVVLVKGSRFMRMERVADAIALQAASEKHG